MAYKQITHAILAEEKEKMTTPETNLTLPYSCHKESNNSEDNRYMTKPVNRLRELDFLRGIAIILVLFRHQLLFQFLVNMGWMGVDLFFVLSGFLVSGLLFKEYQKFGNIKPANFLIRRGFKIYPIYYLSFIVYLIPIYLHRNFSTIGFLSDLLFFQNYWKGWGYVNKVSWSLAIEEHFYFGLAMSLWFIINKRRFNLNVEKNSTGISRFEKILFSLMILILLLRIASNIIFPDQEIRNFTMTHLRIDSLLAGVLVSYLFYFRNEYLRSIFVKYKKYALLFSFALLSFTPFINPMPSFFVKTFGFSMLYVSYSIILIYFLLTENINIKLNTIFGRRIVNLISQVGIYSYSIYIIHTALNSSLAYLPINHFAMLLHIDQKYIMFPLSISLSILCGKLMTDFIESYFLRIRDKLYPNRRI
ncbi:MAG: acyltransferase family protein [Bacteroidia bacterium]